MDRALAETARDDPTRLRELLSPKSIVLVGASDRSGWSGGSYANYEQIGFEGALHLVNRNGGEVHGRVAHTSCAEIGEPLDLALMLVDEADGSFRRLDGGIGRPDRGLGGDHGSVGRPCGNVGRARLARGKPERAEHP